MEEVVLRWEWQSSYQEIGCFKYRNYSAISRFLGNLFLALSRVPLPTQLYLLPPCRHTSFIHGFVPLVKMTERQLIKDTLKNSIC